MFLNRYIKSDHVKHENRAKGTIFFSRLNVLLAERGFWLADFRT